MDPTDFPSPSPAPIVEFSPSLANLLLSCQLRAGFSRDPAYKNWRRPTTYTALGIAAHAVTEAAFKRKDWPADPSMARVQLQRVWAAEIEIGVKHLAEAWSPATPPPPQHWPGFALTKARTLRRATKILEASKPSGDQAPPGAGIELELRDPESGLFGRADRIEHDGASTRVVDLKTGLHQDAPSDSQRRQLLLYAVLVHRRSDQWPASIAVEDASGNRFSQPLEPSDAEAALLDVQKAVAGFNASVAEQTLATQAAAEAERCRWCEFRVVCGPFWAAVTSEWGQRSVLGSINETGPSGGGSFVSLAIDSPADRRGTTLHVSGLPAALAVDSQRIAITDFVGLPDATDVRARWSTVVRAW